MKTKIIMFLFIIQIVLLPCRGVPQQCYAEQNFKVTRMDDRSSSYKEMGDKQYFLAPLSRNDLSPIIKSAIKIFESVNQLQTHPGEDFEIYAILNQMWGLFVSLQLNSFEDFKRLFILSFIQNSSGQQNLLSRCDFSARNPTSFMFDLWLFSKINNMQDVFLNTCKNILSQIIENKTPSVIVDRRAYLDLAQKLEADISNQGFRNLEQREKRLTICKIWEIFISLDLGSFEDFKRVFAMGFHGSGQQNIVSGIDFSCSTPEGFLRELNSFSNIRGLEDVFLNTCKNILSQVIENKSPRVIVDRTAYLDLARKLETDISNQDFQNSEQRERRLTACKIWEIFISLDLGSFEDFKRIFAMGLHSSEQQNIVSGIDFSCRSPEVFLRELISFSDRRGLEDVFLNTCKNILSQIIENKSPSVIIDREWYIRLARNLKNNINDINFQKLSVQERRNILSYVFEIYIALNIGSYSEFRKNYVGSFVRYSKFLPEYTTDEHFGLSTAQSFIGELIAKSEQILDLSALSEASNYMLDLIIQSSSPDNSLLSEISA